MVLMRIFIFLNDTIYTYRFEFAPKLSLTILYIVRGSGLDYKFLCTLSRRKE